MTDNNDHTEQQQQRQQQVVVDVCCGCRPKAATKSKKYRRIQEPRRSIFSRRRKDHASLRLNQSNRSSFKSYKSAVSSSEDDDNDCFFFDAQEFQLRDDEFPLVLGQQQSRNKTTRQQQQQPVIVEAAPEQAMTTIDASTRRTQKNILHHKRPINFLQKQPSQRFRSIMETPHEEIIRQVRHPRVVLEPNQGYPGTLNDTQMNQVQLFLTTLGTMEDEAVAEQIYSFRDVEDVPYTICRWLRATKWDAEAILKRCQENQPMFHVAQKEHQFHPDVSQSIGAPFSLFLSQYPFLAIGTAKNGCPVNYFQAGKINPEGIMCLTTAPQLEGYFWWSFMHKMKQEIRQQTTDAVRCEGVNIIDLKGLSRAALSSETMAVIKLAGKIGDFFPETLNCMLIINAPGFFSMAWGLIKKFIDPQTARRITVCSNDGLEAMQSVIELDQIPSDYGGSNKCLQEAFRAEANDPLLLRQHVELLHVNNKRKSIASTLKKQNDDDDDDDGWNVAEGEYMELNCFTRSVSGATVIVSINGEPRHTIDNVKCNVDDDDDDGQPKAAKHVLGTVKLKGCSVSVEIRDNDDAEKQHNKESRGYFVIVGDVRSL